MRLRLSLGAGVVLVLVAAGIAVLVSALSPHGVTRAAPVEAPRTVHSVAPVAQVTAQDFVHVVGEVHDPGLYELPAGDRIVDAVAAAGGFTALADQAAINLAQVIADGQQIVVPAKGAAADPAAAGAGAAGAAAGGGGAAGGMVDINSADATGLETLDGIGPALAQRILAYRTAHGGFRSVGDLQNVTGIGPKKFAAIKAHVTT